MILDLDALPAQIREAHLAKLVVQAQLAQAHPSWPSAEALGRAFARCQPATRKASFDAIVPGEANDRLRGHLAILIAARLSLPFELRSARAWYEIPTDPRAQDLSLATLTRQLALGEPPAPQEPDRPSRTPAQLTALTTHPAADELRSAGAEHDAALGEIARRLDPTEQTRRPEDFALPVPSRALALSARRFLTRTHDLARELLRPTHDADQVLHWLRAEELEGLPARLSHRWLADVLPSFTTPRLDPRAGHPFARAVLRELPARLGLGSVARALTALGRAWVLTAPLEAHEWVRRLDGAMLAPARVGLLFASLTGEESFVRVVCDGSATARTAVRRRAWGLALFSARVAAADLAGQHRQVASDELEATTLVHPLPRGSVGLLPRAHPDASVRYAAWLELPRLAAQVRDLFDEDWFRNPRSRSWLMLSEPSQLDHERLPDDEDALVRSLERALS